MKCICCKKEFDEQHMLFGHCVDCAVKQAGWVKVEVADEVRHGHA
jgi:hypothetical protein